jgi:hypothetical protein
MTNVMGETLMNRTLQVSRNELKMTLILVIFQNEIRDVE